MFDNFRAEDDVKWRKVGLFSTVSGVPVEANVETSGARVPPPGDWFDSPHVP